MIFETYLNRTDQQSLEVHDEDSWQNFLETLRKKPIKGIAGRAIDEDKDIKSAENTTVNSDIYIDVRRALERNKNIDNSQIRLQIKGNVVILYGKVKSWIQREEAGRVAATFGNFVVVNDIAISYF